VNESHPGKRGGQRVTGFACGDRKTYELTFLGSCIVLRESLVFLWLRTRDSKVAHAPRSFAFLFRLSSQQQNVIDAGYRSTFHGTSVRVRACGGRWAADVCASLWLESQLLLQIADGRADGDSDDNDISVSDRIVYGDGRPTEALEAVLSPTRLVFFTRIVDSTLPI
jgi:hypothetical protein